MKLTTALPLILIGTSSALVPSTRRSWMQKVAGATAAILTPEIAGASLLDDYGSDPSKISEKKLVKETPVVATAKKESAIEPNLRANYYYPTNKKRYLPRIKKCNDAIPGVANSVGEGKWDEVEYFAEEIADNTILPLKLYTSSLTGGGTNVKVSYTKTMMKDAELFEQGQKLLLKAIAKKDTSMASTAIEGMATSLQDYRIVASLTGPDGGGDIPSVDEIRRAACRVQGRTFEKKVLARDARLEEEATKTTVAKK